MHVFSLVLSMLAGAVQAQTLEPVVFPRGVINAVTQQPAPSAAAPGGLVWINGLQLGPVAGETASGFPWPAQLGGTEVLVNNRPAALMSVSPSRVVAQIPWETTNGLAQVVVRRNGATSRPARIQIQAFRPGLRTADNSGYGPVAGTVAGGTLTFQANGLGPTQPRLANGAVAAGDAVVAPQAPVRVFAGGLPVNAEIKASTSFPGEFDISIQIPEGAAAGDVVMLDANNQIPNRATLGRAAGAETRFVRLPGNAAELRSITSSDLRGGFLIASGARGSDGCYPSVLIDLRADRAANIGECLTSANANLPSAATSTVNGAGLAALVGPPQGDVASGVSSKVAVYQPAAVDAMNVTLPRAASALVGAAGGGFAAILAGTPAQVAVIDANGQVQTGGGGVALPGGGGGGGGGAGGPVLINPGTLTIDLGGGLDRVLSLPIGTGPGRLSLVVGNDINDPTRAKVAVLNGQGEVVESRDFPDGWIPLVMPQAQGGAGGGPGGGPGGLPGGGPGLPGGLNPGLGNRLSTYFDAPTGIYYVLVRRSDNSAHGLAAFGAQDIRAVSLPAGWFVASCTPNAQILQIETVRRIVLRGSNSGERVFRQQCGALGFVSMDLDGQQVRAIPLKGEGQLNASAQTVDMNDYLLAPDMAGLTVFVLDGVTASPDRIDLPQGVNAVAQLTPIADMELAVAAARARQTGAFGDAGFVVFDLANLGTDAASRLLQLPDGIATAQVVGILPATRKLVARGTRTGNTGSQFLIYDLATGEVTMPPNPEGAVFVGNPPAAAPAPGQPPAAQVPALMRVNNKANTIEAITYGADRRQNGALLIRVP